jgi:RimJ/RimL family protein N-acetyltransferase
MLIRPADLIDLQDIFYWRNDAFSRTMFQSSDLVSLNEHIEWYQRSLKNPRKRMYIGLIHEQKVGVVRFDYEPDIDQSEVSINLNPQLRGKGYGFTLLANSISLYDKIQNNALKATVKKENIASLKIFMKCKFLITSDDEHFYHLMRI